MSHLRILEKEDCRLILQAGIAAAHHGLLSDAQTILDAIPVLVNDQVQQCLLRSVLLFALQRKQEAGKCLEGLDCDDAVQLRELFFASEEYRATTTTPQYYYIN
jgi:type III secretion system SsaH family protein